VRCWGRSQYGQLGYGNVAECDLLCSSGTQCCIGDNEIPASAGDVEVGGFVVQVATGYNHTCALLDSGDLYCWGWGAHAKLGYGNTAECTNSTSNCSEAAQCCIGDDETPASAGDVPYR
jgi:alpha-tubulin suppressor-like RCC1 family protein